ncbi:MAG: hypothetical protein QOH69_2547 [Actinomycetota bacterium]|nr:hypothetical protein [Actinomycetota bacterium]MDQ1550933.1 hypothetical protein [Actinomycetota bacterium]
MAEKNELTRYFFDNPGRLINKWRHYFDIYDRHLAPFRRRPVTVLEIGIYHGGSLQMWKKYFGKRVSLVGVDIDERSTRLAESQVKVVVGDQSDRPFLQRLAADYGPFDVVIDDGGHSMDQQITSFEELWPHVRNGGIYLVEDLHTSYWKEYGGEYLGSNTFIEYAKRLIDQQHAWHAPDSSALKVDDMTKSIRGMHVYDSIIVFDKADVTKPYSEMTGTPEFPLSDER